MEGRWNPFRSQFLCFLVLIFGLKIHGSWSLNDEGLALLAFRERVTFDPYGVFASWNPNDNDACLWSGVDCVAGKVCMLDLNSLHLEGTLAPELGKLAHLKALMLYNNHFSGEIPKAIGGLAQLELLDLRRNYLIGKLPAELGNLLSLKSLLLCDNKFEGKIPYEISRLELTEFNVDEPLASTATWAKVGRSISVGGGNQLNGADSLRSPVKGVFKHYCKAFPSQMFHRKKDTPCGDNISFEPGLSEKVTVQNMENLVSPARRKLAEQSSNLAAAPSSSGSSLNIIAVPITRSSGAFPAIVNPKNNSSPAPAPAPLVSPIVPPPPAASPLSHAGRSSNQQHQTSKTTWMYFLIIPVVIIIVAVVIALFFICRKKVKTIGPWKTGLSGQLQKAFVSGVPKLNQSELEVACEDFSNIIITYDAYTIYKGTLSSGVEISVASTSISSVKEWPKAAETAYRKKIETLSRINHKNFVNLIGFCEENEPFARMMVFEYAPNGNLFEHLHVKGMEHLDWNARVRIIMGVAYCLRYMHHDLSPPVVHSCLASDAILLTDDYAAKISETYFKPQSASLSRTSTDGESEHSGKPSPSDQEANVYWFGVLLLEIITGKLPFTEQQGPLEKWAAQYFNDKQTAGSMIDPTLKSFKDNELDILCDVIKECVQQDPKGRPTMRDIVSKLREVIAITPEQATPRLSPLWWAELEILSVEAN